MRKFFELLGKRKKKEKTTDANQAATSAPTPESTAQASKRDTVTIATYSEGLAATGGSPVVWTPSSSMSRQVRRQEASSLGQSIASKSNVELNKLSRESREKMPGTAKIAGSNFSVEDEALMQAQGTRASSRRENAPPSRLRHPKPLPAIPDQAGAEPYRHRVASKSAPDLPRPLPPLPSVPNRSQSGDDQKARPEKIPSFFAEQKKMRERQRAQQEAKATTPARSPSPSAAPAGRASPATLPPKPPMSEKARGKQRAIDPPSRSPSLSSTKSRGSDRSGPSL